MSTATQYTNQQEYIKFLTTQAAAETSPCDGCSESPCNSPDCGCCPPGLVSVYDDKSQQLACLTPNDAELFKKNTMVCQDGYLKLYNNETMEFLGCVSEENFAALNESVNPPA